MTNVRTSERSSRADLAECLNAFQMGQMFYSTGFPSKNTDFQVVIEKFLRHCAGKFQSTIFILKIYFYLCIFELNFKLFALNIFQVQII